MEVESTVRALYERAETVRRRELRRHSSRLATLDESARESVESFSCDLVDALLRAPVDRLRARVVSSEDDRYVAAVRYLFGLDRVNAEPPSMQPADPSTGSRGGLEDNEARAALNPPRGTARSPS